MHKTSAWPLALLYGVLIAFASLFPFEGWRAQGISPLVFLTGPLPPPYWTWFDVNINIAGYMPMGFLLALALGRSGVPRGWSVPLAWLITSGLSLSMEFLQIYLPRRVPSNMDLALNALGGLLGALAAAGLEWLGVLDRWNQFRQRWFGSEAHGGVALVLLWPWALLFPAAVPFGLGQVLERLDAALAGLFADTPFMAWLPLRESPLVPLSPSAEALCVLLGLLVPCLLGYSLIAQRWRRAVYAALAVAAGLAVTGLSWGLSYGPEHAWAWLSLPARVGVYGAMAMALFLLAVPRRICAVLLLLALMAHLSWLNQAPTSAYFAHTLQAWEQGRFIRFYGVGQWLGWLWPYALLLYVMLRLSRRQAAS